MGRELRDTAVPHSLSKENNDISDELHVIRTEIIYRNDKIDELIMDIADEMKILRKLLSQEQELPRHCEKSKVYRSL